ncbi:SMI1/KNR4 family protein, partial [Streptomyces sp. NPDC001982]|uniref:SMI1/KNR4 family protein n=1 Tax=Streptomyces sp. NPDC001982 TaxID=3154405 RepID=UPI003332D98D
ATPCPNPQPSPDAACATPKRSTGNQTGGSGLSRCELFTMDPKGSEDGAPRGFITVEDRARPGDRFLHIIEAGCSDVVLLGVTGPLTGRIVTGNSDGFWGPDLSSAPDFIAWYELWLDEMAAGHDNRALELTSPASRSAERRARPTS